MAIPPRSRSDRILPLAVLWAAVLSACGGGDPTQALIENRAQHAVELLSWADRDDGSIAVTLRIQGPVHSKINQLTVEIQGRDATDAVTLSEWVSLDLSGMERGTPFEQTLVIEPGGADVDGLALDMHIDAAPEIRDRLVELRQAP